MADDFERSERALEERYPLQRELGRGGMATVYLAHDLKHDRPVAVKVLKPELSQALGPDRFLREIALTARLDHPHIVPLLDSGEAEGLLYYVMPYVEGESLRERLNREKQLPLEEALRIAREVADALGHAHGLGIVHRDIKPENILLAGGHARVADFGIARAVRREAGSSITETGFAVGTPAYMSPEQARGEREVDARTDVYALASVVYEMLAGEPPFTGATAEAILARKSLEAVPSLRVVRGAVPEGVETAILRALSRVPADRFPTASEFVEALQEGRTAVRRGRPLRVTGLFALASAGVVALVYGLMMSLGLPDWVFVGAAILLALGLPIMLLTGHHERGRAMARIAGRRAPERGPSRHLTWPNAFAGGVLAFVGLMLVTGSFVTLRALGVGPFATLLTAGVLDPEDRLLLADFENLTDDPLVSETVTELLRIDLAQSRVVNLLEPEQLGEALRRMERSPAEPLTAELTRELALREGIKAYLTGDVRQVGGGYVVSARLVATGTGEVLAAHRESARSPDDLIPAIDRLSARLRERVGESLRSIRASPGLPRFTTSSLPALESYVRAMRVFQTTGDLDLVVELLEEAVAADSTFAMAWRRLAVDLQFLDRSRSVEASTRAYELSSRLPEPERYDTRAIYYHGAGDHAQAVTTYERLIDLHPEWGGGRPQNNIAVISGFYLSDWGKAHHHFRAVIGLYPRAPLFRRNQLAVHHVLGQWQTYDSLAAEYAHLFPEHPQVHLHMAVAGSARGNHEVAAEAIQALRGAHPAPVWQRQAAWEAGHLAATRGQLQEAREQFGRHWELAGHTGAVVNQKLGGPVALAFYEIAVDGDPDGAMARVDAALSDHPLRDVPAHDRAGLYLSLASLYEAVGERERARAMLREYRDQGPSVLPFAMDQFARRTEGFLAIREGRIEEGLTPARAWAEALRCGGCVDLDLGRAFDLAGMPDSAAAYYERGVRQGTALTTFLAGLGWSLPHLGLVYARIAELAEDRGDRAKAEEFYGRLIDLWADADPELQPRVEEARARLARIAGES